MAKFDISGAQGLQFMDFRLPVTIILYFSILLHCIVQWLLQVMFLSACSFIVGWFPLYFTTCFGLHGHLQVCRMFYFHMLEGFFFAALFLPFFKWSHSACFHQCFVPVLFSFVIFVVSLCVSENRQTTKKKQADKHTCKETARITKENSSENQKSSKAESFKHMKIKYPTHLKMVM
jgi:Na+/proline symporter